MEFGFTKEQEEFRQKLRNFIEAEMPPHLIMPVINLAEDLYRDEVWELHKIMARKLGERGWLSLTWPKKYGGMEASDLRRLRELEEENRRLKQMYAELSLEHQVLKDVVEKKL